MPASANRSVYRIDSYWVDSTGRRNTAPEGFAMTMRRRRSEGAGRATLRSPGRPSVGRHEERRWVWAEIAAGRSSEDAAVGAGVSELAAAFGLALEMGTRLEDIGGTIHAHPTLGEAFHEASLRALGEALHI